MLCALLPFLLLAGAGLLGWAIGRIWGNSGYDELQVKHREMSDEYGSLDGRYKSLNSKYSDLEGRFGSLNASNATMQTQLSDASTKLGLYSGLKRDKSGLESDLQALRKRYEDLEARHDGSLAVITDLEAALKGVQAEKDAALQASSEVRVAAPVRAAPIVNLAAGNDELEAKLKIIRAKNDELNKEFNSMNVNFASLQRAKEGTEAKLSDSTNENARLLSRIRELEAGGGGKKDLLKAEVDALKAKLADCNKKVEGFAAKKADKKEETKTEPKEEKKAEKLDKSEDAVMARIKAKSEKLNFGRIGKGDAQDDLKRISGIGPFLEKKLYALGITSFRQVSKFNDEDEDMVNDAIEFFPGRVKRDEWVRQAKEILGEGSAKEEVKAAAPVVAPIVAPVEKPAAPEEKPAEEGSKEDQALARIKEKSALIDFGTIGTALEADKDDLKEIKGVGPFIEKKLNALGIYTFLQMSKLTPDLEDRVNEAIEFFPGRVKRDDWKGQSVELHKNKG